MSGSSGSNEDNKGKKKQEDLQELESLKQSIENGKKGTLQALERKEDFTAKCESLMRDIQKLINERELKEEATAVRHKEAELPANATNTIQNVDVVNPQPNQPTLEEVLDELYISRSTFHLRDYGYGPCAPEEIDIGHEEVDDEKSGEEGENEHRE